MAKGLALNKNNDIIIGGTSFTRTSEINYVAQKLRSRLQLIRGESKLAPTAGIPYFTDVFVKPVDVQAVASLIKDEILLTEGVDSIIFFDYDIDSTSRRLTVDFSVNTIYGVITLDKFIINIGV